MNTDPTNRPWSEPLTPGLNSSTPAPATPAAYGHSLTPAASEPTSAELARTLRSVSTALQILIAVSIITIGVVNVMLFHQIRGLRRNALQIQENAIRMRDAITEYSTNTAPLLQRFYIDLKGFASRNPEYAAVFSHYPTISVGEPQHPSLPSAPAPATPSAPRR
jgi:hypothetical protein